VNAADLETARGWLRAARRIALLSGAGMSAESGIATFRDEGQTPKAPAALAAQGGAPVLGWPGDGPGLWSRFDPARFASDEGFRADPRRVWQWYAERRDAVRGAEPNAGHIAIADFAKRHPGRLTVITQNVDDLHQRAGSDGVIRLHGNILEDRWLDACARLPACDTASAVPGEPPRCAACGNFVRPAVVWFGELLPEAALERAESAARCDAMLVVGTSGAVYPAAGFAAQARRAGAKVVIVNPHPSEIDHVAHLLLCGTAAAVLPALLDAS